MSASFKMAQDADDAMSESSGTALAKGKERDWWSIDLEGEMEKLEVVGPCEGGSVDPKRWPLVAREESEMSKEAQEESVEIQSPKKVIREESEETQGYVCESLAISQEEAEEMGFVPSALGEPRGPIHWCDTRYSEKAIRYWQIDPMVVDEGSKKNSGGRSSEKQERIQGQWQQEPPFREVLERVKRSADADCGPQTMRRGYFAMNNRSWKDFQEEYRKEGKSCEWIFERIREAYEKVAIGHCA